MNKRLTLFYQTRKMMIPIDRSGPGWDRVVKALSIRGGDVDPVARGRSDRDEPNGTLSPSKLLTRRPTTGVELSGVHAWGVCGLARSVCFAYVCVDGVSGRLAFSGHACELPGPALLTPSPSPRSTGGHKRDVNGVVARRLAA
jgi:hypothetical protein